MPAPPAPQTVDSRWWRRRFRLAVSPALPILDDFCHGLLDSFKKVTCNEAFAKVIVIVITLTAATVAASRLHAQSASSAKSPLATQLGVTISPDENECYSLAKQQSGVDPATMNAQQTQDGKGAGAKGAAKGAAVGAVAGDAGAGAAVGAVNGRRQQREPSGRPMGALRPTL